MKRARDIEKETADRQARQLTTSAEQSIAAARGTEESFSDYSILKASHQFVRDDELDRAVFASDYKVRLARRYYDRLFKEYAIVDLSRWDTGQLGLRWRTEAEVVSGKGQVLCASSSCAKDSELTSYEVPFKYVENGVSKMELVKCRLCMTCGGSLTAQSKSESRGRKRDGR